MKDPSFNGQEKLMEVCEVCGAFLIIGDAQIRVDDHLQGKQHKGYAQIKAAVEEMKVRSVRCVFLRMEEYLWGGGDGRVSVGRGGGRSLFSSDCVRKRTGILGSLNVTMF